MAAFAVAVLDEADANFGCLAYMDEVEPETRVKRGSCHYWTFAAHTVHAAAGQATVVDLEGARSDTCWDVKAVAAGAANMDPGCSDET